MDRLPPQFLARIKEILPASHWQGFEESLLPRPNFAIRVNTIRSDVSRTKEELKKAGIVAQDSVLHDALLIESRFREDLLASELHKKGEIYLQHLSSQLIPRILDPRPQELVLDMCAAPGSKTTQIAALMRNEGSVVALEKIVGRFHKLKTVVKLLGVENVSAKCLDAKRFRSTQLFDKVLLDAPCSSEGRFELEDPDTFEYWSPRKIKEMRSKQKGLLLRGLQLLKPGGILVYSTCTFAPEENEEVVDWALKKMNGTIGALPIDTPGVPIYQALRQWGKRFFSENVRDAARIVPSNLWHGFFVAKLRRNP